MNHELRLAELLCGKAPPFSDEEIQAAGRHFADLVGVSLAALDQQSVNALQALYPDWSGAGASARIWGTGRRMALRDAGMINGYAAHWHDFDDDETDLTMAHLTVTAMTAAAVVGDSRPGVSGRDVLSAYLMGTELATFLGKLIIPQHYLAGWHSSATLGTFAATVAAGRLLGLDAGAMRHAIGMAASLASGIRSNFGSPTKPLQVGQAVANGILAAECAAAGIGSAAGSLLGPGGYVAMHGGDLSRVEPCLDDFGAPYGFSAGGMIIKAYPCCTAPHSAIWAVLQLLAEHGIAAADLNRIICHIDPGVFAILIYDRPQTPAQAKFSLPYALAAAAVFGHLGISEFTEAAVSDAVVLRMMDQVEVVRDPSLPRGPSGISVASRVELVLRNGETVSKYCGALPGSAGNPLDDAALRSKFTDCSAGAMPPDQASELFDLLTSTGGRANFANVMDRLAPGA